MSLLTSLKREFRSQPRRRGQSGILMLLAIVCGTLIGQHVLDAASMFVSRSLSGFPISGCTVWGCMTFCLFVARVREGRGVIDVPSS